MVMKLKHACYHLIVHYIIYHITSHDTLYYFIYIILYYIISYHIPLTSYHIASHHIIYHALYYIILYYAFYRFRPHLWPSSGGALLKINYNKILNQCTSVRCILHTCICGFHRHIEKQTYTSWLNRNSKA